MDGMSSIEKAVADSPLEDYQAIGQAAKKQVDIPQTLDALHCVELRGVSETVREGLWPASWENRMICLEKNKYEQPGIPSACPSTDTSMKGEGKHSRNFTPPFFSGFRPSPLLLRLREYDALR